MASTKINFNSLLVASACFKDLGGGNCASERWNPSDKREAYLFALCLLWGWNYACEFDMWTVSVGGMRDIEIV
jgi:hypothetical protein